MSKEFIEVNLPRMVIIKNLEKGLQLIITNLKSVISEDLDELLQIETSRSVKISNLENSSNANESSWASLS